MFRTTVDSILADINNNITRLRKHSEVKRGKAFDAAERASELRAESLAHDAEADRADRVAAKLDALLS